MAQKPLRRIFTERLRRLVAESEESDIQRKLAEAAGVSQSTISRMLNENSNVKVNTIDAIARAFGMSGSDFLRDDSHPKRGDDISNTYNSLPESARVSIDNYVRFVVEDYARRNPGSLTSSWESLMDKDAALKAGARMKKGEEVVEATKRKRGRPRKVVV